MYLMVKYVNEQTLGGDYHEILYEAEFVSERHLNGEVLFLFYQEEIEFYQFNHRININYWSNLNCFFLESDLNLFICIKNECQIMKKKFIPPSYSLLLEPNENKAFRGYSFPLS